MKKEIVAALLFGILVGQAHAQVFRCKDASGQIIYSDSVCGSSAQAVNSSRLRANTIDASDMRQQSAKSRQQNQEQQASPGGARLGAAKSCPSDLEIRNMETGLSSIRLRGRKDEEEFLQAELRRAKACSKEDSNYTAEDWKRAKEAQAAQNKLNPNDRAAARAAAEGMHSSAASDDEKARMIADREAKAQRNAAQAQARAQARAQAQTPVMTSCDTGGCWGSDGARYTKGAGNFYSRSGGGACQVIGTQIQCD